MSSPSSSSSSSASAAPATFGKHDRVLRRSEFRAAQDRGRRVHVSHFTLILLDRGDSGTARIGITASRKTANSVGRNRVRRLIREVFRTNREAFPPGYDCIVIVRENVPDLPLASVRQELLSALARRGKRPAATGAGPSADTQRPGAVNNTAAPDRPARPNQQHRPARDAKARGTRTDRGGPDRS